MSLAKKVRALVRRGKLDRELDEEMGFHVERRTQDNIAAGMSAKEAREAALRAFGGVGKMTERCRDARGVQWVESVGQDFRYAIRTLSKDRRFALLAILALATYRDTKRPPLCGARHGGQAEVPRRRKNARFSRSPRLRAPATAGRRKSGCSSPE